MESLRKARVERRGEKELEEKLRDPEGRFKKKGKSGEGEIKSASTKLLLMKSKRKFSPYL